MYKKYEALYKNLHKNMNLYTGIYTKIRIFIQELNDVINVCPEEVKLEKEK